MNVEAVWLTQEGQQWEVVVRLRGGDRVSFRCNTRSEARSRAVSLLHGARELAESMKTWQRPAGGGLAA